MRRGFGPASPKGRTDRRNMLLSKPRERSVFIPALPESQLSWLAGKLGPVERRALREICETGDLIEQDGKKFLVARVSEPTIDALAAFDAEGEDREPYMEDEPATDAEPVDDAEPDHDSEEEPDREPDYRRERQKYIAERQLPEPTTFDRDLRCPVSEPTRYNWPKDLKDSNRVLDAAARLRPKNPSCRKAVPPYWRRRF